jgi:hypothetical protein
MKLLTESARSFDNKKFLVLMIALLVTVGIDASVVKINDIIDKYFIPLQSKLVLFSINSSLIIFLQFIVVRYVTGAFKIARSNKSLRINTFYIISVSSLSLLAVLIGSVIFEQFYLRYFDSVISISIIAISYGTAAAFIIWLAVIFFSWFNSSHSLVVFLYFISMSIIAFNLITTAALTSVKISDRPPHVAEYVGGSGDVTGYRFAYFDNISKITSFMSFFSIWLTTAILMNSYREKVRSSILFWIILSIPLVYFLITYFYQFTLSNLLISYLVVDPVTVSIIIGTFLALSKPIGGLLFGIAFWNIAKIISYERNIRTAMIIAGWGILLIFSANQASTQIVAPYPPFGLATVTVLNIAAYLMLLGIYNSAKLVSANNGLRKFIHSHALKMLSSIGQAEMEKEINNAVKKLSQNRDLVTPEAPLELDENELKRYMQHVVSEVKKSN